MGDRYDLNINCTYCNYLNKDVWYAPTCSTDTFRCEKCKELNFINSDFKSMKIIDVSIDEVRKGFSNASMGTLTDIEVERICAEHLYEIQGESDTKIPQG